MADDLKLCPFCDGVPIRCNDAPNEYWVECDRCGARTYGKSSEREADEAWNRRAYPDYTRAVKSDKWCGICKYALHNDCGRMACIECPLFGWKFDMCECAEIADGNPCPWFTEREG